MAIAFPPPLYPIPGTEREAGTLYGMPVRVIEARVLLPEPFAFKIAKACEVAIVVLLIAGLVLIIKT